MTRRPRITFSPSGDLREFIDGEGLPGENLGLTARRLLCEMADGKWSPVTTLVTSGHRSPGVVTSGDQVTTPNPNDSVPGHPSSGIDASKESTSGSGTVTSGDQVTGHRSPVVTRSPGGTGIGADHPTARMEAQYNPANAPPEIAAALLRIKRAEAVGLVEPDEFQRKMINQVAGALRRRGWLKPIQIETVQATADQIDEDPVEWLGRRGSVRSLGLNPDDSIRLLDWWADMRPEERHALTPIGPGQPPWAHVGAERLGLRLRPPVSSERHQALCGGCSSRADPCLIGRALGIESMAHRVE